MHDLPTCSGFWWFHKWENPVEIIKDEHGVYLKRSGAKAPHGTWTKATNPLEIQQTFL